MRRRDFLKVTAATAAAALAIPTRYAWAATDTEPAGPVANRAAMPRRPFGKSSEQLSIIGFGGLVLTTIDQSAANRLVAEAVERGVNYFDVAPEYGTAEVKMGPALAPYRKKVFLACKTAMRDAEGARREFARSLERLKTDHFDLYQLHHIRHVKDDVDAVFAKGGAWEFLREAKQDGRIRHLGFSAHTEEAALAALDRFDFDSVMAPVSFACWYGGRFGQRVVEKAKEKGTALMALKSLARQRWPRGKRPPGPHGRMWYQPITDPTEQALSVRWTLSQGVTAVLPPYNDALHRRAFEVGLAYKPITDEETAKLKALAGTLDPLFRPGAEP